MVLPCHQSSINPPHACPTTTTTSVEVGLLEGLHKGHIPTCIPSVKPTPDDGLDVMKAVNAPDSTKDAGLEDQQTLGVSMTLNNPNLEAHQGL